MRVEIVRLDNVVNLKETGFIILVSHREEMSLFALCLLVLLTLDWIRMKHYLKGDVKLTIYQRL